jgi:predicted nucleotidyltransferase
MTPQAITSIIHQYLDTVRKSGITVQEAYLFGSAAKGSMHLGSDIDLCIISSSFGHDRQRERVRLMNLRNEASDIIEPHPYSPSDFDNPFDPLSAEIKKTGVQVTI